MQRVSNHAKTHFQRGSRTWFKIEPLSLYPSVVRCKCVSRWNTYSETPLLFHTGQTFLRNFLSRQFEKEKKWSNKGFGGERTWIGDHSLKNLRSIHLGYLRVDECRWKKNRWNHFGGRQKLLIPALPLQAFTRHRHKAFVSRFSSRETVVNELIFLG